MVCFASYRIWVTPPYLATNSTGSNEALIVDSERRSDSSQSLNSAHRRHCAVKTGTASGIFQDKAVREQSSTPESGEGARSPADVTCRSSFSAAVLPAHRNRQGIDLAAPPA